MEAAAAAGSLSPFEQLRFARQVILTESRALAQVANRLDGEFCRAVELVLACRGSVIVCGIGKAGTLTEQQAADLGGAVLVTSLARQRLGYRGWRVVHWLAYLAWPVAFAHSITAGNDLRIWWVALIEDGCALAVATAMAARILFWWRGPDPQQPSPPERAVRPEGMLR